MPDFEILPIAEYADHIDACIENALKSKCKRSRCGSIIIANEDMIIGQGYNSQPCDIEGACFKDSLPANFKSDKTCCVHAEQRAVIDALSLYPKLLHGSDLFFVRLDADGKPESCGEPYCTICSKMALDAGVRRFILYHADGLRSYDTKRYNELSFQYKS